MKNIAVNIENLSVKYGDYVALENICLTIDEGEFLGIMGPNGGGKSTLLKAMLNLLPVKVGKITYFGKPFNKINFTIGYVPQFSPVDKKFPVSVLEVVAMGCLKRGLHPFFKYSDKDYENAHKILDMVGIDKLSKRQISELSGGEFQRMLIARALASNPKILILDEPCASVDPKSAEQIYNLLEELNKKVTIIMVTHDLMAISSKVKRIACLNKTLVFHGEPVLDEGTIGKLYGCPVDLIAHGVPHRVLGKH